MARSVSRSPLFHKGLTVFTSNGTALPLAGPSPADSTAQEIGSSDHTVSPQPHTRWFGEIGRGDVSEVGGKAASLGEMFQELGARGVRVPDGFVTTVSAYDAFLDAPLGNGTFEAVDRDERSHLLALASDVVGAGTLREALQALFRDLDPSDSLEIHGRTTLARALVLACPLPAEIRRELAAGYDDLCRRSTGKVDVAVRSSATCEDSAVASFAGQYESFLNVRGARAVIDAWKACAASAFTERSVSYQLGRGMDPLEGALAVVVMRMVRSDLAISGVIFTLDPDSGNRNVLHISSSYGLGALVVKGTVSPDTFLLRKEELRRGRPALMHRSLGAKDRQLVYSIQDGTATRSVDVESARRRRWSLSREEAVELGRIALEIEEHYGRPMDIEWAKDGYSGELFIVQARPETVHSCWVRGKGKALET